MLCANLILDFKCFSRRCLLYFISENSFSVSKNTPIFTRI